MAEITLPTKETGILNRDPKSLLIFSKPKVGKTTLLSQLPNCLIIDLENGTDYISAVKLKANTIQELFDIEAAIIKAKNPYKYIALDTVSALEELCIPYAEYLYSKSPRHTHWGVQ